MYLEEYLSKYKDKKIKLYVDMDGVIVDYDVGNPYGFDKKRPLLSSIKKLEKIAQLKNIELYILSACKIKEGYNEKQWWLDKYAPFFKKENRNILVKEESEFEQTNELKAHFVKNIERDESVIVIIDDDPSVIKEIKKQNKDVILLKDTVLVD